jgi:hypothetical protein
VTNGQLTVMVLAALKVRPTDDFHYPLAPNQLRHLIARAVEDEREACIRDVRSHGGIHIYDAGKIVEAIRARGEK